MKALLLLLAVSQSWAGRTVVDPARPASARTSPAAHQANLAAIAALPPSSIPAVGLAALQAPPGALTALPAESLEQAYRESMAVEQDDDGAGGAAAAAAMFDQAAPVDERLTAQAVVARPDLARLESWFGRREASLTQAAIGGVDANLIGEMLDKAGATDVQRELIGHVALNPRPMPSVSKELEQRHLGILTKLVELRRDHFEGRLTENFRSLPELVTTYRKRGVTGQALREVLDHAGKLSSKSFSVVLTEAVWRAIPAERRGEVLERLAVSEEMVGHRLTLRVEKDDDLGALAAEFASGRSPRAVERLLRAKLRGRESIELPLQSLLPRFIRRKVDTFEACTGPNCIASALSVRAPYENTGRYDGGDGLAARLNSGAYERASGEPKPGDVLIYTTTEKEFRHAVVYAGRGFVFTKAGMQRYYPHVFQRLEQVESYFFPDGEFRRLIFRPK